MKKIIRKDFLFAILVWLIIFMPVEAEATELKEVKVVKLHMPTDAGGFTYEELKNSVTILSEGVMFPTAEQAPDGWFGIYEEETDAWAHVVEQGKSYRMDIFLSPKEGYKFVPNSTLSSCLLNGSGQGFSDGSFNTATAEHRLDYTISEQFIYISVKNYKIDEWIESVEFSLPDYKVGNEGNFKMVTTTTEGVIADTGMVMAGESVITEQGFQPHTEYRVLVAFVADKGYSLAKLQKHNIKVMGKEPKEFSVLKNGAYFVETDLDILHDGGVANCHTPKICDICQEPYGELDPANHQGETEIRNALQATCTKPGYTGDSYCFFCKALISVGAQTPISNEHLYDGGVITTSPTEMSTGIKTYTCTLCQKTKTEEIPKLEGKDESKEEHPKEDASKDDETKDDGINENGSNESGSKEEGSKEEGSKEDGSKGDAGKREPLKDNGDKDTKIPAKNATITDSKTGMKYRVTEAGKTNGSVEFLAPKNKKLTQITIPDTVKIGGISYKVTSIAKNAFKGCKSLKKVVIGKNITKIGSKAFYACKNLKTITIKTTKLKSSKVGKKAFTGTSKKAQVTVPKKSYKAYKKFLYKKGIYKKAKIKKAKK